MIANKNIARSVAIIDGFAEGKWHQKILENALIEAGFRLEDDPSEADCIISHSAGCFFIPQLKKRQTVMLVGPPYWPGKLLVVSLLQKIWRDFLAQVRRGNLTYWLKKTFWNIVYVVSDLLHVVQMARHFHKHNFYAVFEGHLPILVRNVDDAWLAPDVQDLLGNERFTYYSLPGEHDDIWTNPEPYIEILLKNI